MLCKHTIRFVIVISSLPLDPSTIYRRRPRSADCSSYPLCSAGHLLRLPDPLHFVVVFLRILQVLVQNPNTDIQFRLSRKSNRAHFGDTAAGPVRTAHQQCLRLPRHAARLFVRQCAAVLSTYGLCFQGVCLDVAALVAVAGLGDVAYLELGGRSQFFHGETVCSTDVHVAVGGSMRGAEQEARGTQSGTKQ